jgi:hypothetical protein
MKKDNLTVVLGKFARELNIRIDLQKVYDELLIHPDYPSLLAISDVLQNFGVDNGAYRIDRDKLPNEPCPFSSRPNINGSDFLLAHKIENGTPWCKMAEVTATPTMLLNGYRLPNLYQLSDLKYMLQ